MAVKLLQSDDQAEIKEIHSLQLSCQGDDRCSEGILISSHGLHKLKKLQLLEVDGLLVIDGVEEDEPFPSKLVLLKCVPRNLEPFDLGLQNRLVVLHLSQTQFLPRSIGQLSALRILVLTGLGSLGDEIGHLSKLEYLEFRDCDTLNKLPETFGKLSELEFLKFRYCKALQSLPETFGGLSKLKDLKLKGCWNLHSLPQSFGHLSTLERLKFKTCGLRALPDSFGNLSALKHLKICWCLSLLTLPDSFGNVSALEHFKLHGPSGQFEAFPKSFGKLSALRRLELINCGNFLPLVKFDQFKELEYLEINGFHSLIQLEKLPDSLGELTALRHLILEFISIRSIPDYIKSMPSLHILELRKLPYVKEIPPWLGETGVEPLALSYKTFRVKGGCFSFTREEPAFASANPAGVLIEDLHRYAMEKMRESDYEGALADLCPTNFGEIEPKLRRFLLQERGIVRRFKGDLQGALEDLTVALGVFSEADDGYKYMYDCWKHRGYVNFLLGDLHGAENDGEMALKLLPKYDYNKIVSSPSLGEAPVMYMHFRLVRRRRKVDELGELIDSSHSQVMEKVRVSDFRGALACWDVIDASTFSSDLRLFFFQERGILKRLAGDLSGALEDLTAALEIYGEANDVEEFDGKGVGDYAYNCWKHRGFVKFLLGDLDAAQKDGAMALKLLSFMDCNPESKHERLISASLGEEIVTFMDFRLHRSNDFHKQEGCLASIRGQVMRKVRTSDFSSALNIWENFDAKVSGYFDRVFFLQERGVLKGLAGDLLGALDDLTATLDILSVGGDDCEHRYWHQYTSNCRKHRALDGPTPTLEIRSGGGDNGEHHCWRQYTYNCWKHRSYVNFLLGDQGGAQNDGANALKLLCERRNHIWTILPSCLGDESVAYVDFRLVGVGDVDEQDDLMWRVQSQVTEKVESSDFPGALAIWDDFDARVSGYYNRAFVQQETGILRQMPGDFQGALEDFTGALELWGDDYGLFKYRAFVKNVMRDMYGAQMDADTRVSGFCDRVHFLQERGILKRMAGDLHGALDDLTAALEIEDDCDCFKHRGYVKHLMGDEDGARMDAERCLAMKPEESDAESDDGSENLHLGELPVAFLEFRLKGGKAIVGRLEESSHDDVMEKVREKDFPGAVAIWDDFDNRVFGFNDRVYFLQQRGVLKRMAGDVHGALEDLTAALEIEDDYDCFKHRGYVKHLMGDEDGARMDAERSFAMERGEISDEYLGGFPVNFLEFEL